MYGVACVVEYAQRACPVGTHPSWRRLLALLTQPSDFRRALGLLPRALAFVDTATGVSSAASGDGTDANGCSVVMNSVLTGGELGAGVVVEHSVLSGTWQVGDGCLCSGIRDGTLRDASLSPHTAVQEVRLAGEAKRVLTLHGTRDSIKKGPAHDGSTVCGVPWSRVFELVAEAVGVDPSGIEAAIWPASADNRTLWNAQLFPVCPVECDDETEARAWQAASLWMQVGSRYTVCVCGVVCVLCCVCLCYGAFTVCLG